MEIPELIDKRFLRDHYKRSMQTIRRKVFTNDVIRSFMTLNEWQRTKTFSSEQSAAIKKIILKQ